MPKYLERAVSIMDPETGEFVHYQQGESPPEHVAKLITNPSAWDDPDKSDEEKFFIAANANAVADLVEGGEERELTGEEELEDLTIPELRKHAAENDIDLGGLNRKQDIIDAIRAAEDAG